MSGLNFWFMGNGQFASLCLEGLIKRHIHFSKIITGLPTRSGRNSRETPSPVETKASELGLDVVRSGRLNENQVLVSELEGNAPDVIFVIDFGQVIREPFLSGARLACLNIHPSKLPEFRGAAPIQRAILEGRAKTGVSVFRLAETMDAGDILARREEVIGPEDRASDLYVRLSDAGCELAVEALKPALGLYGSHDDSFPAHDASLSSRGICHDTRTHSEHEAITSQHSGYDLPTLPAPGHNTSSEARPPSGNTPTSAALTPSDEAAYHDGILTFTPQDDSLATYAPKLTKEEACVSFNMTASKIHNTVRALDMSGGAYTLLNDGKRLKLWRTRLRDDMAGSLTPGQVLSLEGNPVIACSDSGVELLEIQGEGRKKTSGSEWARGMRLNEGDIL